jgi:hypothetical protein
VPPPLETYDEEELAFYNKLKAFIEGKDEEVCAQGGSCKGDVRLLISVPRC